MTTALMRLSKLGRGTGRGDSTSYPEELGGSLGHGNTDTFLTSLKTTAAALSQLKILYAPAELLDCEQWAVDQTARSRIEKVCTERGIEIVYEHHHFLEDSQIPLDFWRRHRKERRRD